MERATDAAVLARRYGVKPALKRALYELVRAQLFMQSGSDEPYLNFDGNIPIHYLWLVGAREQLVKFWMQKTFPPEESACVSLGKDSRANRLCAITRGTVHVVYKAMVHDSGTFLRYRHDPMVGLQALIDSPWVLGDAWPSTYSQDLPVAKAESHLCVACANRWRATWRNEKEALWKNLDAWFGIEVNI